VAGWQALFIGLVAILGAGYIGSFSNTHFDGVLDAHSGMSAPIWFFLSAGLIDWLCMCVVLMVFGKIVSKTPFRVIDVMGTQAMARYPTILTALVVLPTAFRRFNEYLVWKTTGQGIPAEFNIAEAIVFGVAIIMMLMFICWMVRLMYKGYAVSCNVKGGKAIGTFIAGLVIAETISKVVIIVLINRMSGGIPGLM
jgi:hypothetical protein